MGIKGALYGIKVGGDFVDCEVSCDINIQRDMINKSGSHGGQAKHFRYGYYTWDVNLNAKSLISSLKGSFNKLIEAQLAGEEIELLITSRVSNTQLLDIWGNVLIPNLTLSFPNTGLSTYSVSFKGNGILNTDFGELAYLTDNTGNYITDESSNKIMVKKKI